MIFLDELEYNRIYRKPFFLPINEKDKKKGSCVFLLTPRDTASIKLLNNPLLINKKYFESYFIERDITYYINNEGYIENNDLDLINETKVYAPNIIFLSEKNMDGKTLHPRVPDNFLTRNGYEESTTKRVCFAGSIDKALIGLSQNLKGKSFYVHRPAQETKIEVYNPGIDEVPDSNITGEIWGLSDVKLEVVCKIKVTGDGGNEYEYKYGEDKKATLYDWSWVTIEGYLKNNINESGRIIKKTINNIKNFIKYTNKFTYIANPESVKAIEDNCDFTHHEKYLLKAINECESTNELEMIKKMSWLGLNKDEVYEMVEEYDSEQQSNAYKHLTWCNTIFKNKVNSKFKTLSEYAGIICENYKMTDLYLRNHTPNGDVIILFNENTDDEILNESKENNPLLKKILYNERLKNNKGNYEIYDVVKSEVPYIRKTYLDYKKYNSLNLFVDLFHHNKSFIDNNMYKFDKGIDLYFDFINRFIKDKRLNVAGYTKKTVFLPINGWEQDIEADNIFDYKVNINPISMILRMLNDMHINKLDIWKDIDFIILSDNGYIKLDLSKLEKKDRPHLSVILNKLYLNTEDNNEIDKTESKKAIVANIVDRIEDTQKIKINNLTGDGKEIDKDELVKKIEKAAAVSTNTDDALDKLDEDDYIKNIINNLASQETNRVDISKARLDRMHKLTDEYYKKDINGKSVKTLLDPKNKEKELPITKLNLDTVNEEWENLQYINFEEAYDIDEDIALILDSLSTLSSPLVVRDIMIENTSTSEDYKNTYNVKLEDTEGGRFTIKFDVPIMKDNKFMVLRGNDKTINGQLVLLPISKTDEDTVQIVSNYKKIFIRRFGTSKGKSYVVADRTLKTIEKCKGLKTLVGDNVKICNKYELPIDYIDIAGVYSNIETKHYKFYFNQDEIRDLYKIDNKKGIPYGYDKTSKEVVYYTEGEFSPQLNVLLRQDSEFNSLYDSSVVSTRYTYSKASILSNEIPLILIMAYNEGLVKALDKAHITYELSEKRPKYNKDIQDIIKFSDGFILYYLDYNSSLLLNGLKACNTEDFSLSQINDKAMYLEFLDSFGGRILADGLDNFYDLMIDPITKEVLEYYKLPTDYVEILAYSNMLLADNKYIRHTDMRSNRYRSNELIAGYIYQSIATSYEEYRLKQKRGRKATMSMKQSIVLDKILVDPTCSDKSSLNALNDIETINSVSFKGLAGMNSDRGYSLDKRTYDNSMLNILGMSTGFAGNVGITRQATLDMNIEGKRGYLKINEDTDQCSITKTFTATEALTPFGATRDDPFRSAMTFIQTAKHAMRTKVSHPLLISNGADQALPYMTPSDFSFNAKDDGEILEVVDGEYMILKYKNGITDFIDISEVTKKNSNGGFYITVKLDNNGYKAGKRFKKGDVLAYDKLSYSDKVGHTDNIAYNLGVLTKIAILNTDEGFEDSAIISDWLSEAMASDVVLQKDISLPANTNIYNMAKKGMPIQEGDPLIVFQNSFEEDDINIILKNLADGDEEIVSELGRIPVKSKITGNIQDIKMYRTVEKEELSDSLRKKVNEIEKPISEMKKIMKKYNIEDYNKLDADYKLENSGKLKNLEEGVLIEFYLKYEDKMSVGDKLVYFSALKGVIKDIFPKGKEPVTNFRPNEKIHSLLSQGSVVGRMVCSIKLHLAINKILIELDRQVKEIAGIKWKNLDEM